MEFREVLAARRMVRAYLDTPIPDEVIDLIVDAGRRAPSAGFAQGQRFVVVTDPSTRAALADAAAEGTYLERGFDPWLSRAPVHVVVCTDPTAYLERYAEPDKAAPDGTSPAADWPVPYWWVDAGASLMAILLAAVDAGLAAGFLGGHAFDDVHGLLGIPEHVHVVGVVTIGHAAADRPSGSLARGWRERGSVVYYDAWGDDA